jgi:hypothetical protein
MQMRKIIVRAAVGAAIGTAIGVTVTRVQRWRSTWGVEPGEATKPLPGDDIVPNAMGGETRGITIDAPPEAIWPWLVQMGYGKAGWYSWDQLDQKGQSITEIVEAWQTLAVGDIVPTHPGGGFEVAAIDPGHSLVLRSDTALVNAQAEAAKAASTGIETATKGVQVSGAILSGTPQQFSASWAFVLEPLGTGQTRLIERFRIWFGSEAPGSSRMMPFVGFGVLVMMHKQMLGIRDRAERLAGEQLLAAMRTPAPSAAVEPAVEPVAEPAVEHVAAR